MVAKSKLNSIELLVYTALTNSNISYYKYVLINNVLKEYDDTKEEKKKLKRDKQFIEDFSWFIKQYYHIVWSAEKIQRVKIQKL